MGGISVIRSGGWVTPRNDILATSRGLMGETQPIATTNTASAPTGGTMQGVLCPFRAGEVITTLLLWVGGTGGSGLTLVKVGIYDPATAARLAASADVKAAYGSTGVLQAHDLSSPWVATGPAYACILVTGTTPPTLQRGVQVSGIAASGGLNQYVSQASQTDLPATATFSNSNLPFWFGWR